jgi:hypothetical protein
VLAQGQVSRRRPPALQVEAALVAVPGLGVVATMPGSWVCASAQGNTPAYAVIAPASAKT